MRLGRIVVLPLVPAVFFATPAQATTVELKVVQVCYNRSTNTVTARTGSSCPAGSVATQTVGGVIVQPIDSGGLGNDDPFYVVRDGSRVLIASDLDNNGVFTVEVTGAPNVATAQIADIDIDADGFRDLVFDNGDGDLLVYYGYAVSGPLASAATTLALPEASAELEAYADAETEVLVVSSGGCTFELAKISRTPSVQELACD